MASGNVTETQDTSFVNSFLHEFLGGLLYTYFTHIIGSWWSQWVVMASWHCYSLSWVMVWHFVINSDKVMTAPIVVLPSKCSYGDFFIDIWDFRLQMLYLVDVLYVCLQAEGMRVRGRIARKAAYLQERQAQVTLPLVCRWKFFRSLNCHLCLLWSVATDQQRLVEKYMAQDSSLFLMSL